MTREKRLLSNGSVTGHSFWLLILLNLPSVALASQGSDLCNSNMSNGCVITVGAGLNTPHECTPPAQGGYGIGVVTQIGGLDPSCDAFDWHYDETYWCHNQTAVYSPSINGTTWYHSTYYKYFVDLTVSGSSAFFVIDTVGIYHLSPLNFEVDIIIPDAVLSSSNITYYQYLQDHLPERCFSRENFGPPQCRISD